MINTIVKAILDFFVYLLSFLANLIFLPITGLINSLFPNLSNVYIANMNYFFNHYVFNGIRFAKQVFVNVTHFNTELFGITVTMFTFLFGSLLLINGTKIFVNLWRFFRKGE